MTVCGQAVMILCPVVQQIRLRKVKAVDIDAAKSRLSPSDRAANRIISDTSNPRPTQMSESQTRVIRAPLYPFGLSCCFTVLEA